MAVLRTDNEDAGSCFDDVIGDGFESVNLEHSLDLREKTFEESEVTASDALNRGDGLCVGEVVWVEDTAESFPLAREDEEEFVACECAVAVREPEAAVQLGVVAEALIDSGHPDENDRDVFLIVAISEHFKRSSGQSFCLVDDEQFYIFTGARTHYGVSDFAYCP